MKERNLKKRRELIRQIYRLLTTREKIRIAISSFAMTFSSIFDLIAIFLMGMVGIISITGTGSGKIETSSPVYIFLDVTNLASLNFQQQVAILGCLAALLFVTRTLFNLYIINRLYLFLGHISARLSATLFSKQFNASITDIKKKTSQEILYSCTSGIDALTLGLIASLITMFSDVVLLIILVLTLSLVDLQIALGSLIFFFAIGLILHQQLGPRTEKLGIDRADISIHLNHRILELVATYRENTVRKRKQFLVEAINDIRFKQSKILAEFAFLPSISKYVLETAVIMGALLISASQFLLLDAKNAAGTLAVFIAAGSRMAPAILRLQQGLMTFRNSVGASLSSVELFNTLNQIDPLERDEIPGHLMNSTFNPEIYVDALSFCYPGDTRKIIDNSTFRIVPGDFVAIVGVSGSGKSTLVDLLMGLLQPTEGTILISGVSPQMAQNCWPGVMSYIPQDVEIVDGSIRENVTLGYNSASFTDAEIWNCLKFAGLEQFVVEVQGQIHAEVGESGNRLSGGQRQRLGIARSMISNPKILVLDEATSALDSDTENIISSSINSLNKTCTIIAIAHRESTIRKADKIIFLDKNSMRIFESWKELDSFKAIGLGTKGS